MTDPRGSLPQSVTSLRSTSASQRIEAQRRDGLLARIARRTRASAEIVFPAVPALTEHYVDILADHFAALGQPFSDEELASLGRLIREKAIEGFRASPYANVFVRYSTSNDDAFRIDYGVAAARSSLAEEYAHWVETREPPLFGASPDARLLAALDQLALPTSAACLDIGAGTGRNTLPLARRGHAVDAVEPAPSLADVLEAEAAREGLPVRVVRADVLAAEPWPFPRGRHAFALASQVTSHFRSVADLESLLRVLAFALAPGGHALITAFLTRADYRPDSIAREAAQALWSTFFTHEELVQALSGLPLRLVSDENALAFERDHLPPEHWPPTGWFEGWAQGQDLFGPQESPPISLRWLTFRREPGEAPPPVRASGGA